MKKYICIFKKRFHLVVAELSTCKFKSWCVVAHALYGVICVFQGCGWDFRKMVSLPLPIHYMQRCTVRWVRKQDRTTLPPSHTSIVSLVCRPKEVICNVNYKRFIHTINTHNMYNVKNIIRYIFAFPVYRNFSLFYKVLLQCTTVSLFCNQYS